MQPQLIQIDPQRIKFSAQNPRQHRGSEYLRLKQSVNEVGIVQMPTVRVLPGGFYECIDGEGRVQASQEAKFRSIWVVSLGVLSDAEALTMMQAANTVRSFSFLAECRGLANLHRQGVSGETMVKKLGGGRHIIENMAIGYFPDNIFTLIQEDASRSGERDKIWSQTMLSSLLPLRQTIGDQDPRTAPTLDGVYDYTEVRRAVERVIGGEISTPEQMVAYVERRRRELFEERFDQELQVRLATELAQVRQALQETYEQQLVGVQEETTQRYETQVATLRKQLEDLERRHTALVKDVARRPELIARQEADLRKKLQETEAERIKLQNLQRQVQEEALKAQKAAQSSIQQQVEHALKEQRATIQEELKKARADLDAFYAQKDQERQLKAEQSVRQAVAHGVELLAQTQQWVLHLTSPGFAKGIGWLQEAEIASLLAEILTVRDTLEQAAETIRRGNVVDTVAR